MNESDWKIDYESEKTLINWITKLDLICMSKEEQNNLNYISSTYYIGMVVSLLIFPRFSEILGRVKIMYVMAIFALISNIGMIFFSISVSLLQKFYFFNGASAAINTCVTYNYILEFLPKRWKPVFSTLFFAGMILPTVLYPLYFMYISKNWIYF